MARPARSRIVWPRQRFAVSFLLTVSALALWLPTGSLSYAAVIPPPTLLSVNPSTVPAGSPTTNLVISHTSYPVLFNPSTGCGLRAGLDGNLWAPVAQTNTSTTISVPGGWFATPGTHTVWARDMCEVSGSNGLTITVAAVASISSLSPSSILAGSGDFTLTVTGTNFVSGQSVQWNGAALTTTFVTSTQLTATVPAANIAAAGTATVTANNANGNSNSATLTINNPAPTLSILSASSCIAPCSNQTITLTGTNLVGTSQVRWDGSTSGVTTTYGSATSLTATLASSLLTTAGTHTLTIVNPTPGGGTSNGLSFTVTNPTPTLSAIDPSSTLVGSPDLALTVTGANYTSDSTVHWNGAPLATTFVSSTQLTATVPAANLATAGSFAVSISNTSGTSGPATFTINNPAPTLTSLSPGGATAGASDLTLTANGGNFVNGSVIRWNGVGLTTTFVSAAQLTATVPAASVASPGTVQVTVFTPSPGGGTSGSQPFTLSCPATTWTGQYFNNETFSGSPALTRCDPVVDFDWNWGSPDSAIQSSHFSARWTKTVTIPSAGAYPFTYEVDDGFYLSIDDALILNGDSNPPGSTYSASPTLSAGVHTVRIDYHQVTGPNYLLDLNRRTPSISSLSPASRDAGNTDFTLYVNGTNFVPGSTVNWNGSARPTTYIASTQLSAAIPTSAIPAEGSATITVLNPLSLSDLPNGGLASNSATFAITDPPPIIGSLSPSSVMAGSGDFTLTINGSLFEASSVLQWNGANRTTTFVSGTQITAQIPAADVALAGTNTITVINPGEGGGISDPVNFTVTNPLPAMTGLTPASVTAGTPGVTVTVTGSNLVPGSIVQVNGLNRTTTFAGSTQVSAPILASELATTGSITIRVFNPAPGGGLSNAMTLEVTSASQTITFDPIPDKLAGNLPFTVSPTASSGLAVSLTASGDCTVSGNTVSITGLGSCTITASQPGNATYSAAQPVSRTFAVSSGVDLTVNALTQDGDTVLAPFAWSGTPSSPTVDCGTPAQTLIGLTGTCGYSQPGTYTVTGTHTVSGAPTTLTRQVTVPSLAPIGVSLSITAVDGQAPTLSGGIYQTGMPSHYPVPVTITLTFQRPAQVGILESLDLGASTLSAAALEDTGQQAVSWNALSNPAALPLSQTGSNATFSTFRTLTDDSTHWMQRVHFQGQTTSGTPLSADLLLQGPIGDGSGIQLTVKRLDPVYLWAPGVVSYRIAASSTLTEGEPLTPTWTVTKDNTSVVITKTNVWTHVPLTSAGTYQVSLTLAGPLSGSTTWTDTVTMQTPPAPESLALTCTPPLQNRPPATYRCSVASPERLPGERLTANPTWRVDGTPAGTSSRLTRTFTAAGAHNIQATIPTSLARSLTGSTTVTVNANQLPTAAIDCTKSWRDRVTEDRHLYCRANVSDPDGRVTGLQWAVLETGQSGLGLIFHRAYAAGQALTVQLTATDDSGAQTIVQQAVDLGSLP